MYILAFFKNIMHILKKKVVLFLFQLFFLLINSLALLSVDHNKTLSLELIHELSNKIKFDVSQR